MVVVPRSRPPTEHGAKLRPCFVQWDEKLAFTSCCRGYTGIAWNAVPAMQPYVGQWAGQSNQDLRIREFDIGDVRVRRRTSDLCERGIGSRVEANAPPLGLVTQSESSDSSAVNGSGWNVRCFDRGRDWDGECSHAGLAINLTGIPPTKLDLRA